jgi:hypothetical protein
MRIHLDSIVSFIVLCACTSACDLNRVAVDTTAGVLAAAEPSARSYFDWESAGYASAAGIVQFEGLHLVSPDNDRLSLTLVKAYMAYAYGWVMDAYEEADQRGDYDLAEHHKQRAFLMYTRARDIAERIIARRDPSFPEQLRKDPKTFAAYLQARFGNEDLPALFWMMMAWTSAINNSTDASDLADMTAVRAIAEWVVVRNPGYEDAGALVFLGGFESSYPPALGGHPEKGKAYFERALKLTGRKNHIVLVNYAMLYAVSVSDRALFLSLLREIVEARDLGSAYRMTNKVARRRAGRALRRTEELFP